MMQNPPHIDLLAMIEAHIARTGLSETRFGSMALGDPNLVRDLRNGRELRRETNSRVIRFMLTGDARITQGAAQ